MRQVYGDVGEFFHAVRVFFDELAAVGWAALAIALGFHLTKVVLRTVAYRNILRASYPGQRVRWAPVTGAYIAGVGVNSIVPGRGGDLVKLYLIKQRLPGATYTTLASTLLAETVLDIVLASCFFLWALTQGFLAAILHGQASTSRLLALSIGMYAAVTVFNLALAAAVIFAMMRTLRLREILGRAKAAEPGSS